MGNRVAFRSLRNHYYRARETRRDNGCGKDWKKPGTLLPLSRIFHADVEFVFRLTEAEIYRDTPPFGHPSFGFRLDRDAVYNFFLFLIVFHPLSLSISFFFLKFNVARRKYLFIFFCICVYLKMVLSL